MPRGKPIRIVVASSAALILLVAQTTRARARPAFPPFVGSVQSTSLRSQACGWPRQMFPRKRYGSFDPDKCFSGDIRGTPFHIVVFKLGYSNEGGVAFESGPLYEVEWPFGGTSPKVYRFTQSTVCYGIPGTENIGGINIGTGQVDFGGSHPGVCEKGAPYPTFIQGIHNRIPVRTK